MPLEARLTPGASPGSSPGYTRLKNAFVILSVLAICVATLRSAGDTLPVGWSFSLAEGDEAIAEIIQNLLLFLPFGVALVWRWPQLRWRQVLGAGVALSFTVEFLQQWIPGRDPSVGDIVANATSTLLGAALVWTAPRWVAPSERVAPRLALGAAGVAAVAWLATGWLFQPSFPQATYFDRWTPDIPKWPNYDGHILWATLGPNVLEHGPIGGGERGGGLDLGHDLLAADAPIRVNFTLGPPPDGRAPLFTITDVHHRDVFIVGIDHTDLLITYRNHANELRLARPDLRAPGALAGARLGDTVTVMATRECINTTCGLGHTIGAAWTLIFFPDSFPPWALKIFNALWVGGGLLGVGLWGRRDRVTGVAVSVAVVTLALGPLVVGLKVTPVTEWLGAAVGFAIGLAWRGRSTLSSLRAPPFD